MKTNLRQITVWPVAKNERDETNKTQIKEGFVSLNIRKPFVHLEHLDNVTIHNNLCRLSKIFFFFIDL